MRGLVSKKVPERRHAKTTLRVNTMTLTKASEKKIEQLAAQAQESFLDNATGAFFRRSDWWSFWTVLLASFAVYFYTLAPTLTLEDSGELAVASDYLGVPHPPG